jgi:hypothetical protein
MKIEGFGKETRASHKKVSPIIEYGKWAKNVLKNFKVNINKFNTLFPNNSEVFAIGWGIENSSDAEERNNIIDKVKDGNHKDALSLALFPLSNPTPVNQFVLNAALLKDENFIKRLGISQKELPNLTTEDLPEDKSDRAKEINKLIELEFKGLVRLGIIEVDGQGNDLSFSLNSEYADLVNKYAWPIIGFDGSYRKSLLQ